MTDLRVKRLIRFGLNTPDLVRLAWFYEQAFGSRMTEHVTLVERGTDYRTMTLGESTLELRQFANPGRPYPTGLAPQEAGFQHFAVVVADMQAAYHRLQQVAGWTAISVSGPQHLPERAGGVTAFKFRDPDGHPLELLSFPSGAAPAYWQRHARHEILGIDHSAISVADVERTLEFYSGLGLQIAGRTVNHGSEQRLLDGVADAVVDVIALAPPQDTPHVEALHYRGDFRRIDPPFAVNDSVASRLVFESASAPTAAGQGVRRVLRDPDGHVIEILPSVDVRDGGRR